MDRRREIIREYKENPPPAGIFRITNSVNGKMFLGTGINVQGKINSNLAQLRFGGHRNRELQEDWNRYGSEKFSSEVLDYLKEDPAHPERQADDLAELLELWLDKLRPYGERGYNK